MGKKIKLTREMCEKCKYSAVNISRNDGSPRIYCDYLSQTGYPRVFEKGKQKYDGYLYCDKFEEGDRPKNTIPWGLGGIMEGRK